MIRPRKNRFAQLQKQSYLEIAKLSPFIKDEKTQLILQLIFTFAALIIFGLFAINPTIGTIIRLQKELTDSRAIDQQLDTKNTNLSSLYNQYTSLSNRLQALNETVPRTPDAPKMIGQIQALGQKHNISITSLQTGTVELANTRFTPEKESTFIFTVIADGTYQQLEAFLKDLVGFERILILETITFSRSDIGEQSLRLTLRGKAYYKRSL